MKPEEMTTPRPGDRCLVCGAPPIYLEYRPERADQMGRPRREGPDNPVLPLQKMPGATTDAG